MLVHELTIDLRASWVLCCCCLMLTSFFKYFFLFLPCGKVYASYFLKELVCQLSTEYVFHRDLPVFFLLLLLRWLVFVVVVWLQLKGLFCFVLFFYLGGVFLLKCDTTEIFSCIFSFFSDCKSYRGNWTLSYHKYNLWLWSLLTGQNHSPKTTELSGNIWNLLRIQHLDASKTVL